MSDEHIEIRIKYSNLELEIKGSREDVDYFLDKIFALLSPGEKEISREKIEIKSKVEELPKLTIKGGEALTDILSRLFSSRWGGELHTLREIIEALESYGLYYSKSTVAVSLNRLVKRGVLRRIKGKDGIYRYVTAKVGVE